MRAFLVLGLTYVGLSELRFSGAQWSRASLKGLVVVLQTFLKVEEDRGLTPMAQPLALHKSQALRSV